MTTTAERWTDLPRVNRVTQYALSYIELNLASRCPALGQTLPAGDDGV